MTTRRDSSIAPPGVSRPSGAPSQQVRRLRDYLDETHPGTALPGESSADRAIRIMRDQRRSVSLAEALVRALGIDGGSERGDGSTRPPGRMQPYHRRREVIAAIQIEPGLANFAAILMVLPEDRFKISATRAEVVLTDLRTGEVHLAWVGDWLVRDAAGDWTVVENSDFSRVFEPVVPVGSVA